MYHRAGTEVPGCCIAKQTAFRSIASNTNFNTIISFGETLKASAKEVTEVGSLWREERFSSETLLWKKLSSQATSGEMGTAIAVHWLSMQ